MDYAMLAIIAILLVTLGYVVYALQQEKKQPDTPVVVYDNVPWYGSSWFPWGGYYSSPNYRVNRGHHPRPHPRPRPGPPRGGRPFRRR